MHGTTPRRAARQPSRLAVWKPSPQDAIGVVIRALGVDVWCASLGVELDVGGGPGGLLADLTRRLVESAMNAELSFVVRVRELGC